MATHWTDRRTAVAMLGGELARRGWKLYGWKEDKSDSMTDYYDPERWDGLAERDGVLVVVGMGPSEAGGHQPVKSACDVISACARCGGSGDDPSGLTYQWAKENPRAFNAARLDGTGPVAMFADVVSPLHFRDYGPELCRKCSGGGKVYGNHRMEPDGPAWPEHKGNPPGRLWHVERAGAILASGVGVYAVASERFERHHDTVKPDGEPFTSPPEHWDDSRCRACGATGHAGPMRREECPKAQPKLRALVDRIEAAAFPERSPRYAATAAEGSGDGVSAQVTPGKRPGYVDVRFPAKPAPAVIGALKAAGFRWAPSFACWYGPQDRLPSLATI